MLKKICIVIVFSWFWVVVFIIFCVVLGWFKYGEYEFMCMYNFSGMGDKWKM